MAIDITKQRSRQPKSILWIIGLVAVVLFVVNARNEPTVIIDPVSKDTVLIVPPVGVGSSMKIDEWAKENNVEIRRYREGDDLTLAEPDIRRLFELTKGKQPCAITSIDGQVKIIPINDDLLNKLESLK